MFLRKRIRYLRDTFATHFKNAGLKYVPVVDGTEQSRGGILTRASLVDIV